MFENLPWFEVKANIRVVLTLMFSTGSTRGAADGTQRAKEPVVRRKWRRAHASASHVRIAAPLRRRAWQGAMSLSARTNFAGYPFPVGTTAALELSGRSSR